MPLKIASWNVNSINSRLGHVQDWLKRENPDILFLQELKTEFCPPISDNYQIHFVGQKAYNGVAILTRHPIEVLLTALPNEETDTQARYLEAEIAGLRVINIYLPNGNPVESEKFLYKLQWMDRLYKRLLILRSERIPFLVGGDFNVIPAEVDCYDPELWKNDALFHHDTLKKYHALLNLGLTDALRVMNQTPETYTFWDYQAGAWPKNHGIRIDHFLLSPALTDRLITCKIDRDMRNLEKPSDHVPIFIEIS